MTSDHELAAAELQALDKAGRQWLKRRLIREVRCHRCGDPVYQLVQTQTPYPALRYRATADSTRDAGGSFRHYLDTGEYVAAPSPVRLAPGWLFHLVGDDADTDPRTPWYLTSACPCGQFHLPVRDIVGGDEKFTTAHPQNG